ncbi:GRID1 [Mytilus edulis]|uniref:GRID1 n=1 Tax=Mytilus edulis TaxID=6550 RepID=A0A8S3TZR0_MYTED|nr:GRID1 [Mytilus edulis]
MNARTGILPDYVDLNANDDFFEQNVLDISEFTDVTILEYLHSPLALTLRLNDNFSGKKSINKKKIPRIKPWKQEKSELFKSNIDQEKLASLHFNLLDAISDPETVVKHDIDTFIQEVTSILLQSAEQSVGTSVGKRGWDYNCLSIETLMWSDDRRRELTTVGHVYFNGSLRLENDIFPNIKFGFNQRKFVTSLLPWKPYVEIDEATQEYKGMTIELLKELSHRLNFTYELIHPPDGKWGVASNDNIWNGMLGQLQRREVDLVAAPLIIDAHRETVADFTQPYFHEKSGIIIKKPVQSHSTKLVDPLNPMVYLCVGISLPVITFLLFLFEKYNPFYRQVPGRMNIRGLHHFYDSFWYMCGALLFQGGEHVAASSAGRTLLSCWWIFCIVIVTTYCGNFVAFLTVTKELLPFNDVEGLVAQNTYIWGTAGQTVFETILKNSELPERRKLWNGIFKFNQSDPSVLSSDPAEQIRKVRGGNYAFIGERTYLDMAIGKSCDMSVISTADFHPLLIALSLPNNSPFLKVFSNE